MISTFVAQDLGHYKACFPLQGWCKALCYQNQRPGNDPSSGDAQWFPEREVHPELGLTFDCSPPYPGVLGTCYHSIFCTTEEKGKNLQLPSMQTSSKHSFPQGQSIIGPKRHLTFVNSYHHTLRVKLQSICVCLDCLHRKSKWSEPSPCFSKRGVGEKCRFALCCRTEIRRQFSSPNGLF